MGQPLNAEKARFAESLAALALSLGFELDEPQYEFYWRTLADVPEDIRSEAMFACTNRKWFKFPQPAEMKAVAADVVDHRRKDAFRKMLASDCTVCHGSRWASTIVDGKESLRRCQCWTVAMKAMKAVAEPIERPKLMLPPEKSLDEVIR